MQIVDNGIFIKAIADKGYKLYSPKTNSYHDFIIVGKIDYLENYKEVKDPQPIYEEEQEKQIVNNIINENAKSASNDAFSELVKLANNIINE